VRLPQACNQGAECYPDRRSGNQKYIIPRRWSIPCWTKNGCHDKEANIRSNEDSSYYSPYSPFPPSDEANKVMYDKALEHTTNSKCHYGAYHEENEKGLSKE